MELTGGLMIKLTRRKPKKASILASEKVILNGFSRRHFPSKEIPGAHGGKPMGKHDAAKTAKNYFQKSNEEESKIFFLLNLVRTTCNHKMFTSDGSGMYPK